MDDDNEQTGRVAFRWLGVAGIELTFAGQVLAVDPFFTRPPLSRLLGGRVAADLALANTKLPRCDHILVTHAHYDHLMDVPAIARSTGATVHGSANTCRLLAASGVPAGQVRLVRPGDALALGAFRVQVLPGSHTRLPVKVEGILPEHIPPPSRVRDYRMDSCYSYLIDVGGLRLLNWRSIRWQDAPRAQVLFVHPGEDSGWFKQLLADVQPAVVIPIHWDDFFRPLSKPIRPFFYPPRLAFPPTRRVNLPRFQRIIEGIRPGTGVLIPEIFEPYDLAAYRGLP